MEGRKRKSVLILIGLLLLILFIGIFVYSELIKINNVKVKVNDIIVEPHIFDLGSQSGGSYWDSSVLELPCVSAKPGENIEIVFLNSCPSKIIVTKYDIFYEENSLGRPESRGEPEKLILEWQESAVSFVAPDANTEYQLIRCCCTWKFLFAEKDLEYIFSIRK